MKEEIEKYLAFNKEWKDKFLPQFKEWCKDKSIPVDERWELFLKSGLGKEDGRYHRPNGLNWNKLSLYDDFYLDKYAWISVESMFNRAKEKSFLRILMMK